MAIRIRVAAEDDGDGMLDIYAPVVRNTPTSYETAAPGVADFRGRIGASLERRLWLVCEIGGFIAGYAYATHFNPREAYTWSVEVSVYVHHSQQRRGIGHALSVSLFRCLALRGYCRAVARITLPNPASVALHEAIGFQPVGVNRGIGYNHGRWHDVRVWQLEIRCRPSLPETPRPPRRTGAHAGMGRCPMHRRGVNQRGVNQRVSAVRLQAALEDGALFP